MAILVGTTVEIVPFTLRGCQNNQGVVVECADDLCCPDTTGQILPQFKSKVEYMLETCGQCAIIQHVWCDVDLVPIVVPISTITRESKK